MVVSATDGDPRVSNQVAFTIEKGLFVNLTYLFKTSGTFTPHHVYILRRKILVSIYVYS